MPQPITQPDCPALDPAEAMARLALLPPAQMQQWRGLPLAYLGTPEGQWHHRFTPDVCAVALVDAGCLEGGLRIEGRLHDMSLRAGSLALFHAGQEVRALQERSDGVRRLIVEIDPAQDADGLLEGVDLPALRPSTGFEDAALAGVMRAMLQEVRTGCPNGHLYAESLSLGLLLHLRRTRAMPAEPRRGERGRFSAPQRARLDELISNELANDLSLSTLCGELGMSRTHFVRMFQSSMAMSPHRYVMRKRLERAHELIVGGVAPLAEIALSTGFSNQSHLHRLYRDAYGATPGAARRSGRHPG